ncbi:hypothetical protein AB0E87_30480, partial [Streptomyces sp. NPDC029704]
MLVMPLDGDAELRVLEPWNAEEYLAHIDRSREFIGRYIALADHATDLASARAFLQRYADKADVPVAVARLVVRLVDLVV